ncbi:unnamed protein product [Phytomonas sp. Hart1]|nr:unnamed protein product [Phytomonas sp. Hart1]|eukprot:CCW72342.1 unnamed protein product [Phytomonas sp. isolate Hart1]
MACICGIISLIVQFAVLGLVLAGILLDEFRPRNADQYPDKGKFYITLWGVKDNLYKHNYKYKPSDLWSECSSRVNHFKIAACMAIIAVIIAVVRTLLGILHTCCCCICVCIILPIVSSVGTVAGAISIGYMLFDYKNFITISDVPLVKNYINNPLNQCVKLEIYTGPLGLYKDGMEIGLGLKLFIAGCALNTLNISIASIPL